jgi:hypothetical protein
VRPRWEMMRRAMASTAKDHYRTDDRVLFQVVQNFDDADDKDLQGRRQAGELTRGRRTSLRSSTDACNRSPTNSTSKSSTRGASKEWPTTVQRKWRRWRERAGRGG